MGDHIYQLPAAMGCRLFEPYFMNWGPCAHCLPTQKTISKIPNVCFAIVRGVPVFRRNGMQFLICFNDCSGSHSGLNLCFAPAKNRKGKVAPAPRLQAKTGSAP